jgi:di/tricarboxylate transporter
VTGFSGFTSVNWSPNYDSPRPNSKIREMTLEVGFLFLLLGTMVFLFMSEKIPVDLTALSALVVLIFTGYVAPEEAFLGFASPAVITMLAVFILSGALLQTGLAEMIGTGIHRWTGGQEVAVVVTVMLVAAVLSAFMNNIAATAVLMPAVASLARRTGTSPSRLFIPLAFGAIMGGTTTSVGTPPNIIVVAIMRERGLTPFNLFDFTPLGSIVLILGIGFMVVFGRRLLPSRRSGTALPEARNLGEVYQLQERLFSLRIPSNSPLDGLTLAQTRLGNTLGVQVLSISRLGNTLSPGSSRELRGGDVLLVEGDLDQLRELLRVQNVEVTKTRAAELPRMAKGVTGIRAVVRRGCPLIGQTLKNFRFREYFQAMVVGIQRDGRLRLNQLGRQTLQEGDELFVLALEEHLERVTHYPHLEVVQIGLSAVRRLQEDLFLIGVPKDSPLVGLTVSDSRFGELVGITVAGIIRQGETRLAVSATEVIAPGDQLLIAGEPSHILELLRLGEIGLESHAAPGTFESEEAGLMEAAIAPRSGLAEKNLGELKFRERYGLRVLAIWREGRFVYANLADITLRFGDALLLHGPWSRMEALAHDPDFVVLTQTKPVLRRRGRAPYVLGALGAMIALVVLDLQPIHVAAMTAAVLAALSGAVRMEEAYRSVEWRALILVAAVLPVGGALERTGAALLLADSVVSLVGPFGPYATIAALVCLSSLLSQALLDGAPAVVLLLPVALHVAEQLGMSPYPAVMAISIAASAAFMTPFSHKANLLVMGAGGYRVFDYFRVGAPLTLLVLIALTLLVPVFFAF